MGAGTSAQSRCGLRERADELRRIAGASLHSGAVGIGSRDAAGRLAGSVSRASSRAHARRLSALRRSRTGACSNSAPRHRPPAASRVVHPHGRIDRAGGTVVGESVQLGRGGSERADAALSASGPTRRAADRERGSLAAGVDHHLPAHIDASDRLPGSAVHAPAAMSGNWIRYDAAARTLRLSVYVQPNARRTAIVGLHGEDLKVSIAAPAVDNKANLAVIAFVADVLGVPASSQYPVR